MDKNTFTRLLNQFYYEIKKKNYDGLRWNKELRWVTICYDKIRWIMIRFALKSIFFFVKSLFLDILQLIGSFLIFPYLRGLLDEISQ